MYNQRMPKCLLRYSCGATSARWAVQDKHAAGGRREGQGLVPGGKRCLHPACCVRALHLHGSIPVAEKQLDSTACPQELGAQLTLDGLSHQARCQGTLVSPARHS